METITITNITSLFRRLHHYIFIKQNTVETSVELLRVHLTSQKFTKTITLYRYNDCLMTTAK
jgi:hypothetical protein